MLDALGSSTLRAIGHTGATATFFLVALGSMLRRGVSLAETSRLVAQLGTRCLVPVLLVVAPMGAILALEGHHIVRWFGVERLLAPLVTIALTREIAPGFAALMVAMQAGGSIAAELGAMRVRGEIDARKVMAVDPVQSLVVPRLVAGILVTPLISLVGVVFGIGAAYLVAVHGRGLPGAAFIENGLGWLSPADLWGGELKALIYGVLITSVSCYHGYHAERSAAGVGIAANRAVVHAILLLPVANYAINTALYSGVAT